MVVDLPDAIEEDGEGGRVALGLGGHGVVEGPLRSPGPEGMARLNPLALDQGLEATDRPTVRIQYDLGNGAHAEGNIKTLGTVNDHGGVFLVHALGDEAAGVEDFLDVGEPAGEAQFAEPLLAAGARLVGDGLHQFGVGVEEEVVAVDALVDVLPSGVVLLHLEAAA